MDRVKRRIVLTMAALSPGVVAITLQEMAVSVAFMVLGVFGALSVAAATVSIFPQIGPAALIDKASDKTYPSLLVASALARLRIMAPDPIALRVQMHRLLAPNAPPPGFMTDTDQIAMVLSQIIARWDNTDLSDLTDDQLRELWLVERLMRASPAEAAALSSFFAAPDAMLAMRDALAVPASV